MTTSEQTVEVTGEGASRPEAVVGVRLRGLVPLPVAALVQPAASGIPRYPFGIGIHDPSRAPWDNPAGALILTQDAGAQSSPAFGFR